MSQDSDDLAFDLFIILYILKLIYVSDLTRQLLERDFSSEIRLISTFQEKVFSFGLLDSTANRFP